MMVSYRHCEPQHYFLTVLLSRPALFGWLAMLQINSSLLPYLKNKKQNQKQTLFCAFFSEGFATFQGDW